MKERFSAIGSLDLWVLSSLGALTDSGFEYIKYDPNIDELTGRKDGTLSIKFVPDEFKTILEIDSNSDEDIELYKESVAKVYSSLQQKPENDIQQEYKKLINNDRSTEEPKEPGEWYKSEWFILLISVLIPPVGIYLIHKFEMFNDRERKILIAFFAIYTVLWAWLLTIPFLNRSTLPDTPVPPPEEIEMEENPYAANELTAYWSQQPVINFVNGLPNLMTEYDNLHANSQLGTANGNAEAEEIFGQIKSLDDSVLSVGVTAEDNSAYTLSQKVAETANLFNAAIDENRNAINSGDPAQIENALNSWYNAENNFYEINYLYEQANQSVNGSTADTTQNTQNPEE